jgi:hypothetical protein
VSTTQAKIAAKKLTESSGIQDEVAERMYHAEDAHYVAIIDLAWLDATHGRGEKKIVRLDIQQLEIMTGDAAEHCRELMRSVYMARQPEGLDGTRGEPAGDIIRRGESALLTCDTCLRKHTDPRIKHYLGDPDADEAWCTWIDDGTEVRVNDDADEHGASPDEVDRDSDLTGALPVGADA